MVLSKKDLSMEDSATTMAPVRVAVRIRPLLATDRLHEIVCAYATPHQPPQPAQILLGNAVHAFDYAFNPDTTQSQIFQTSVAPLMDQLLEGYDTSIVMYGHSTTGKTHTLFGPGVHCVYSEAEYGIIPRATRHIYGKLAKAPNVRFNVKVTFLEICNGSIRDLLATNQYQQEVVLDENAEGYPVVLGAEEVKCENVSEVFNCLHAGMNARQIAWDIDGHSVCHYIFQILVEQKWVTAEGLEETRLSLATFADLGSFDNHGLTHESFAMDCGLIALNNVVTSIQWHRKDDSYQQSVLTRLLKESFGGRCYSLIICCISPASLNFDESVITLKFADRVKNVQNTPKVSALLRIIEETNGKEVDHAEDDLTNADTFRLEFAASQWSKLVHNAEKLFKTLVNKNLSRDEKEQIEQWLSLKEECEEVVASDEEETGPPGKNNRLEKIDEVTETEDKTDSSKDGESPRKPAQTCEEKESETETEEESEADNQRPDFHERLEEHMDKLRETMEEAVAIHEDILQIPETEETDSQVEEPNVHPVSVCFPKVERRRSVDPETDRPLMMRLAQQNACSQPNPEIEEEIEGEEVNRSEENRPPRAPFQPSLQHLDPQQQLKLLSAANEAKQHQMKEVLVDLDGTATQLRELQRTIQIKEEFIGDMMKNTDTRTNAKQKCQRKQTKLTQVYYKIMAQLTQAESSLSVTNSLGDDKTKLKKEVEKYKKQTKHYDKRIKHLDDIKHIAADSAKRALEVENSLQTSKRQMEKLKQRLQRAEARKISLEQELLEDQHKIKKLENKFQEQEHEKERSNASSTEGERLQWIQVEEERLMKVRESSQRFQEQLIQQQSILEKREAFLKEKICLEKQRNKSIIMEVSARISHLDQVLKEKSTDLEHIENADEKKALRHDIHILRSTRDCLVEQREVHKDKTLSTMEERKLLQFYEAMEAIDAAIEYKNELLCGRKGGLDSDSAACEEGEQMLMDRLNKLPPMEMRMLIYKYFQKVVDLKVTCRKMEVQLAEKEMLIDKQMWQFYALSNLFKQQQIKEEQQQVQAQRQYHVMVNHFLKMFAEVSSSEGATSSSEVAVRHKEARTDAPTDRTERTETKNERRNEGRIQFRRFLGLERGRTPDPIPQKNLKTLQASRKSTATVTVEKNKLIIEQKPAASNR